MNLFKNRKIFLIQLKVYLTKYILYNIKFEKLKIHCLQIALLLLAEVRAKQSLQRNFTSN